MRAGTGVVTVQVFGGSPGGSAWDEEEIQAVHMEG